MDGQEKTGSPEWERECGKQLLAIGGADQMQAAVGHILRAFRGGDREAAFIVGDLMLRGFLKPLERDPEEVALEILCNAAERGDAQARALLNAHCFKRYEKLVQRRDPAPGPLTDFEGKPIRIKRKGVLTPVDAALEYVDGINRLTLSLNVVTGGDGLADPEGFEKAVADGILSWQGEYRIFGGQRLQLAIRLTDDSRLFDSVYVIPVAGTLKRVFHDSVEKAAALRRDERMRDLARQERSFAIVGLPKWSVHSRKYFLYGVKTKAFPIWTRSGIRSSMSSATCWGWETCTGRKRQNSPV